MNGEARPYALKLHKPLRFHEIDDALARRDKLPLPVPRFGGIGDEVKVLEADDVDPGSYRAKRMVPRGPALCPHVHRIVLDAHGLRVVVPDNGRVVPHEAAE